jgi:thymidine kinase
MGGGKTTELLRRARIYAIAKHAVILVKPDIDTRSGALISTHDNGKASAITLHRLMDACCNKDVLESQVVGVDEGQFFPDLADGCEELARMGKKVIVAALSGDSDRKGFPSVMNTISIAESITMLSAVCTVCSSEAHFTAHYGKKTTTIKVGDIGEYAPLCRACWMTAAVSPSSKTTP